VLHATLRGSADLQRQRTDRHRKSPVSDEIRGGGDLVKGKLTDFRWPLVTPDSRCPTTIQCAHTAAFPSRRVPVLAGTVSEAVVSPRSVSSVLRIGNLPIQ